MFRKPTILIRPLELKDIDGLREWREYQDWPSDSHSLVSSIQENIGNTFTDNKVHNENKVLIL